MNFTKTSYYQVQSTINLESKLSEKTIENLNIAKIFNAKWPQFNITMRSIQYKGITVGFDGDQFMPTLG